MTDKDTPRGDQYFYVVNHPILKDAEVVRAEDYDRLKAELRQQLVALEQKRREDVRKAAMNAVDQFRRMQRELYTTYHTFEGPILDVLSKAMQDAFGSAIHQEETAFKRAAFLEIKEKDNES